MIKSQIATFNWKETRILKYLDQERFRKTAKVQL